MFCTDYHLKNRVCDKILFMLTLLLGHDDMCDGELIILHGACQDRAGLHVPLRVGLGNGQELWHHRVGHGQVPKASVVRVETTARLAGSIRNDWLGGNAWRGWVRWNGGRWNREQFFRYTRFLKWRCDWCWNLCVLFSDVIMPPTPSCNLILEVMLFTNFFRRFLAKNFDLGL